MASMRDLVTSMSFFVECLSLVQPRWFGVEVRYVRDLDRQVTLDELKKDKRVLCRARCCSRSYAGLSVARPMQGSVLLL